MKTVLLEFVLNHGLYTRGDVIEVSEGDAPLWLNRGIVKLHDAPEKLVTTRARARPPEDRRRVSDLEPLVPA